MPQTMHTLRLGRVDSGMPSGSIEAHSKHRRKSSFPPGKFETFRWDSFVGLRTVSQDTDTFAGLSATYISATNTADCWQHLPVTNTDTGASIDVTATDNCKICGDSDLYLSTSAFKALNAGSLNVGTLNITWAWPSSSGSSSSVPVSSSNSVSVSSSSADSSSHTFVSVAEAVTPAPTTSSVSSTSASTSVASSTSSTASAAATGSSSNGWTLSQSLAGQNLINYFTASSGASDNSGVTNYVDNLISVNSDGDVLMWVDTTENVNLQNSMKLSSSETFNVGTMMIFDIVHMPTGCGTWPALWLLGGGTWPAGGKIDIIEGVDAYVHNVMSIHTSEGCSITQNNVNALVNYTINVASNVDCCPYADQDQTCATTSTQTNSYGSGFNAQGGTYAIQIIEAGIYTKYWAAGCVPRDTTNGSPNPSSWSAQTFFSAINCAVGTYFTDLALIIDTNLGGTFTEGGQQTSCASSTGYSTAASYVENVGSAFSDAYWQISSINIYSQ
ncbi:hypothetical protein BT96DRAFT_945478 [Gymnopus androsaceus JB14]|uniref:GH16 domain-containing protein n=1 Tax=Gymnopus androsaceus JB14 TaxID=1447944 RepID=A0A6A4H0R6_9AGAR|nr:hypothetical protein BT96DRAFT_945478 [Gymnopus androsaceus JB14]